MLQHIFVITLGIITLGIITLGIADLARSRRFYAEGFGWRHVTFGT